MNKICLLLLGCALTQVLAARPDWYPADPRPIRDKCLAESSLSPKIKEDIQNHRLNDNPAAGSLYLCTYKAMNVYSTQHGFNAGRLAYVLLGSSAHRCYRQLVRECVTKYIGVRPQDVLVFKVVKCIREQKKTGKKGCK